MTYTASLILYLFVFIVSYLLSKPVTKRIEKIKMRRRFRFKDKFKSYLLLMIMFAPLIILSGLRVNTGADYQQYIWNWDKVIANPSSGIISVNEPLYGAITYFIFIVFGYNIPAYFTVISFLTFSFFAVGIVNMNKKISLPFFITLFALYCYLHTFNYLRQMLALSLCFTGFVMFTRKRYISYFISVVCAFFVHESSIVFLILPLISLIKDKTANEIYCCVIIIITVCLALFAKKLTGTKILGSYAHYFNSDFNFGYGWIVDILPLLIILIAYRKKFSDRVCRMCFNIALLAIPFRIFGYFAYGAGRLFITFVLFAIIGASILPEKSTRADYNARVACFANGNVLYYRRVFIAICFFAFFIFYFYIANNSSVFPYNSIFTV